MGVAQILIICCMMIVFIKPEDLPIFLQGVKKMIRMYKQFVRSGQDLLDQIGLEDPSGARNKSCLSTSSSYDPSNDNTEQRFASASSSDHRAQQPISSSPEVCNNARSIK